MSSTQPSNRAPRRVAVRRSDPIYNAHSYLTKVPVAAIQPFLEAFTAPGDTVLDPFGGSGMTGIAAAMSGRRAILRDISVLGQHIGSNYLNLVEAEHLRRAGAAAIESAASRLQDAYRVPCVQCNNQAELSRTVWTAVYECRTCKRALSFYRALEAAEWSKQGMSCPHCDEPFAARGARRLGEEPVLDTVSCECSPTLRDQAHTPPRLPSLDGLSWPDVEIEETRQMFKASALGRNNLRSTAAFFSQRNLASLAAVWEAIDVIPSIALRDKLRFVFTAILTRASKRYQWSRKRPLNAANANYYVAPVFYEWNVFDLFDRKLEAVLRSDAKIRTAREYIGEHGPPAVEYAIGSADALPLEESSVNYIFTDPPFGSNIFYSDMSLFQEAWLERLTDDAREAVVDRSGNGSERRTAARYEQLMTDALRECSRVLKPGGWLSLVFSNSSGAMWGLMQRAVAAAGFTLDADSITVLDKGQRSVKGLASGFENVVTADLVFSIQKREAAAGPAPAPAPPDALTVAVDNVVDNGGHLTPTTVYLEVVREYLSRGWVVSDLDISAIGPLLSNRGFEVDRASGELIRDTAVVKRARRAAA